MSPESERRRGVTQRRLAAIQLWLGPFWIVLGALWSALWIWGAVDGDLSGTATASERFIAWSRLVLGVIFVALGIVHTILIRRQRRRGRADDVPAA